MRNWKKQTKRMKRIFAMLVAAMLCLSPLQQHVLAAEIPEEAVTPEDTAQPEKTTEPEETEVLEGTTPSEEETAPNGVTTPVEGEITPDTPEVPEGTTTQETPEDLETPATSLDAEKPQGAEENQEPVVKQELVQSVTEAAVFKAAVQEAVENEDPEITGVIYVNANFEPKDTTETTETPDDSVTDDVSSEEPEEAVSGETQSISGDDAEANDEASEEDAVKTEEISNEENEDLELTGMNISDEESEHEADAATPDETVSDETDDVQLSGTVQAAAVVETAGAPVALADEEMNVQVVPKGSVNNPCKTLADAVKAANELKRKDVTIEIQSDLTATECARINSKDVTIKGHGHTITRGDGFAQIQDNARSTYNPAMIEVCDPSHSIHASLRLEDITLDDGEKTAGTKYSQATTDGKGGNGDTVQDAIIATYDGVGTITLGNNVTLKGYGGMSAVRLSGGTLIMENGSKITGGKNFSDKGGGFGPAGAVWIQGGSFTMDEGAKIEGVIGRAVYLDGAGSNATINGTITGIIPNSNMWQGTDGVAMHIRNESNAVIGATGKVINIEGGSCALSIISSSFTAQSGSEISGLKNTRVANANGAKAEDKNPHIVLFDGAVKDCTYGDVQFWAWYARYIIGPNAVIENTTASSRTIGMFYLQNGGEMEISGKIQNNNNTVVYMGNQGGGGTVVKVKDGAYIHNNNGYGVCANNSGYVIMEGGEISANSSYGLYIRAKSNWPDSRLDMFGGRIVNNKSYGIYYAVYNGKSCYMNITGGEISGNKGDQVYISGAYAQDERGRAQISANIIKTNNGEEAVVGTSFGKLTFDKNYSNIYLGNAMSAASSKIKELVKGYKVNDKDTNEYEVKGYSALWFKPTTDNLHFTVPQPSKYAINYALPLYVTYIPLKPDGTPMDDARLTAVKVSNVATIDVELKDLIPDQSYALMWVQPKEKFGTFTVETESPEVNEVLGESAYVVEYKTSYTLTKDIAKPVEEAGNTFTAVIELDPALNYYMDGENNSLQLEENVVFELTSDAPELKRSSDGTRWIMTVGLKVKDGFVAEPNKSYPVNLTFKAIANITNDDFKDDILKTNGYLLGSVKLSGIDTNFKVETPKPAETILKALPVHTVTYTGGSITVKEGTALALDLAGGAGTTSPSTVTEDITLGNPGRDGYSFTGWRLVNGTTAAGIPSVTFIAQWTANETPAPTPTPTTPTTPTTTTPPAPAPLAMAPTVLPAATPAAPAPAAPVEIAEPETPLAEPEAPAAEPEEAPQQIEEPEVPLASGVQGSWALLNLLLMLFTAVSGLVLTVSAARREEENEKRKKALRISSLVPAVVSVAVFVLTENLRAPMRFVNARTMWMVLFAAAQIALIVLSRKSEEEAQVEE